MNTAELVAGEGRRIAELLRDWPPDAVERVAREALAAWGEARLGRRIRWRWNPRLRTTIGRAFLDENLVELNPVLLARHPAEMRAIVIHEWAHLVAAKRRPREPSHGPTWRALMRAAGAPPRATHRLPVEDLRRG